MPEMEFSGSTLPSLDAVLPGQAVQQELLLSIAFHPDPTRIGQFCVLDQSCRSLILGRDSMEFSSSAAGSARAMEDPYVSRRALTFRFKRDRLVLQRDERSCRCRVGGKELLGEVSLTEAQLGQGVAILLAHSVVLWLAYAPCVDSAQQAETHGLIGSSRYMAGLRQQIDAAADCELDVLLRGETGTGKELVAEAIHRHSRRAAGPLISVNMAAIPESLAPSALFGAARGAYTGASRPSEGYFQQANGGTLFLDEIGDASPQLQPQLLRALQQREVQVVGGEVSKVNLRVISATDADIDDGARGFKSALRHRLGGMEILLQPLRLHREDIGPLLLHFLTAAFTDLGRQELLPGAASSARAVAGWAGLFHESLCYTWPGNVRQLANFCGQLAVASRTGLVVPPAVLDALNPSAEITGEGIETAKQASERDQAESVSRRLRRIMEVSDEEFDRAMRDNVHEVKGVAQSLGVSRQAVYRKIADSGRYRLASQLSESEVSGAMQDCGGDLMAMARLLEVSPSSLHLRLRQDRSRV